MQLSGATLAFNLNFSPFLIVIFFLLSLIVIAFLSADTDAGEILKTAPAKRQTDNTDAINPANLLCLITYSPLHFLKIIKIL